MKNKQHVKNKFIVSFWMFVGGLVLPIAGGIGYAWFIIETRFRGNDTSNLAIEIVLLIMLVILPLTLFVWSIFEYLPVIEVHEKGLTKRLFGIHRITMFWDEVADIRMIGALGGGWIKFSKSDLTVKRYFRRDRITMRMNPDFYEAVKHYSDDVLNTKRFASLPQDIVRLWGANKDRIGWGGDRLLPRGKVQTEAGVEVRFNEDAGELLPCTPKYTSAQGGGQILQQIPH